jgi:hypothetical protein
MGCSYRWNKEAWKNCRILWKFGLLGRRLEVNFRNGEGTLDYWERRLKLTFEVNLSGKYVAISTGLNGIF